MIVFAVFLYGCSIPQSERSVIRIDEPTYNFGEISVGDSLTHEFVINNVGNMNLEIIDAKSSCGCTVVQFKDSVSVKPKESISINVLFIGQEWQADSTIKNSVVIKTNTDSVFYVLTLMGKVTKRL